MQIAAVGGHCTSEMLLISLVIFDPGHRIIHFGVCVRNGCAELFLVDTKHGSQNKEKGNEGKIREK